MSAGNCSCRSSLGDPVVRVSLGQQPHGGLQATLTGQEKASARANNIPPSSIQPQLHNSASQVLCKSSPVSLVHRALFQ